MTSGSGGWSNRIPGIERSRTIARKNQLFDDWPDRYDRWFETPLGSVIKTCEQDLSMEFLAPVAGETILDAGCGTGVFTLDVVSSGADVVGLDLSLPMLAKAASKFRSLRFSPVAGDLLHLPFKNETFDKAVSITALEFINDARGAVAELFRVTRRGGLVVVATLNRESPWAERRIREAHEKETIFSKAIFRSPREMVSLVPFPGIVKTAVHFQKGSTPEAATDAERAGREKGLQTGAFLTVRWQKV
jgi:ubiquinone/menaquinone biosynthesis C-methylase UbiE